MEEIAQGEYGLETTQLHGVQLTRQEGSHELLLQQNTRLKYLRTKRLVLLAFNFLRIYGMVDKRRKINNRKDLKRMLLYETKGYFNQLDYYLDTSVLGQLNPTDTNIVLEVVNATSFVSPKWVPQVIRLVCISFPRSNCVCVCVFFWC